VSWNESRGRGNRPRIPLIIWASPASKTTRDQLARLHRRRLIGRTFHDQRKRLPRVPAGTAERMLRISQLASATKQLDEIGWRLWWEGFDVEPDLIRTYILKERLLGRHERCAWSPVTSRKTTTGERDVLEEVFSST